MKSIWIFKLGLRSLLNSISKTKQSNFLRHFLKNLNWFSFKRWLLPWASMKCRPMNVRSLKSREHFCLVKDTILHNGFDIFTVSETWADLSVSDASLEISGYQLFRRDRGQHKAGGDLCTYVKPQDCCAWEFIICLRRWLSTTLAKSSMQKVQIVFDLQHISTSTNTKHVLWISCK